MYHSILVDSTILLFENIQNSSTNNTSEEIYNQAWKRYQTVSLQNGCTAELHIVAAETSVSIGQYNRAELILKHFFEKLNIQYDQFYFRALILRSRLVFKTSINKHGFEKIKIIKQAISYITKAIDISSQPNYINSYSFIIYNCSLYAWDILHSILDITHAKLFSNEIYKISNALESIQDPDIEWRVQYLAAVSYCYFYDDNIKISTETLDKGVSLFEEFLTKKTNIENELQLKIKKIINEAEQIKKNLTLLEATTNSAVNNISERESNLLSFQDNLSSLAKNKFELEDELSKLKAQISIWRNKLTGYYLQRVHINPSDSKRFISSNTISSNIYTSTAAQIQSIYSGIILDKDIQSSLTSMVSSIEAVNNNKRKSPLISTSLIAECYIDIARVASRYAYHDIASNCLTKANQDMDIEMRVKVKIDLLRANMLASTTVPSVYTSTNGDIIRHTEKEIESKRLTNLLEALKTLDRIFGITSSQLSDVPLSIEICTAVWSISIPLLQPHLRHHIYRLFSTIVTYLDKIDCKMLQLRAMLHLEIAYHEESGDFLASSLQHAQKAFNIDYGQIDEKKKDDEIDMYPQFSRLRCLDNRIIPMIQRLTARVDIYGHHDTTEDQAFRLLQQYRETKIKSTQVELVEKCLLLLINDNQLSKYVDKNLKPNIDVTRKKKIVRQSLFLEVSLEEIESMVSVDLSSQSFCKLDPTIDHRYDILHILMKYSHSHKLKECTQIMFTYLMSFNWNIADDFTHKYVRIQIEACFMLSEALVERMNTLPAQNMASNGIDYRSLGVEFENSDSESIQIKKLLLHVLNKAIHLSMSLHDFELAHNGMVYFWNFHLHIFRKNLYTNIIPDFTQVIKYITETISRIRSALADGTLNSPGIDSLCNNSMRANFSEVYALLHNAQTHTQAAIDTASKATACTGSIYSRKRLAELVCRLQLKGSHEGKSPPIPKFDSAFLTVFGYLTVAEETTNKDARHLAIAKTASILASDISSFIFGVKWDKVDHAYFNEILEMQVESWTRLSRLYLMNGDVLLAQEAADTAIKVIISDQSNHKFKNIKILRWLSLAERYFGIALHRFISPEEKDEILLFEVNIAALQHIISASSYGLECKDGRLVTLAAMAAWNICDTASGNLISKEEFFSLLKDIIHHILKIQPLHLQDETRAIANTIIQNLFLAIVEALIFINDNSTALSLIDNALKVIPVTLQKPLVKWKIFLLNRKGSNVMNLIQKLKEKDSLLQANIFGLLARSSLDISQKFGFYMKTVDSLDETDPAANLARLDYIIETSQAMITSGVSHSKIYSLLSEIEKVKLAHISKPSLLQLYYSKMNPKFKSKLLNCRLINLIIRASAIKGEVSSNWKEVRDHYLDVVSYMTQEIQLIDSNILLTYKLKSAEQSQNKNLTLEEFIVSEINSESISIPTDNLFALLSWKPSNDFLAAYKNLGDYSEYFPCDCGYDGFKAIFQQSINIVDFFQEYGLTRQAFHVLAYLRVITRCISLNTTYNETETFTYLNWTHFKIINIFVTAGMLHEAKQFSHHGNNKHYLQLMTSIPNNSLAVLLKLSSSSIYPMQQTKAELLTIVYEDVNVQSNALLELILQVGVEIALLEEYELSSAIIKSTLECASRLNNQNILSECQLELASIDLRTSRYSDCVCRVLQNNLLGKDTSDLRLIASSTRSICKAYLQMKKSDSALDAALQSYNIIKRVIDHTTHNTSEPPLISKDTVNARVIKYFAEVVVIYIEALVENALANDSPVDSMLDILMEVDVIYTSALATADSIVGTSNIISSKLSASSFNFAKKLSDQIQYRLMRDSSTNLVDKMLQQQKNVIEYGLNAINTYVSLLDLTGYAENYLLIDDSTKNIKSMLVINLIKNLIGLAMESIKYSKMLGETKYSSIRYVDIAELSAIERFMITSKPPEPLKLTNFLPRFVDIAESCCSLLNQYASYLNDQISVIQGTCAVMNLYYTDLSIFLWDDSFQANEQSITKYSMFVESDLSLFTTGVLNSIASCHFDIAAIGCEQLFLFHGCRDPTTAAMWLMKFQSLRARHFLQEISKASIPKTSKLSNLWHSVESDSTTFLPSHRKENSFSLARYMLLRSTCPMWTRLSVGKDVSSIIESIDKTTFVLSLQFNADFSWLYACFAKVDPTTKSESSIWTVARVEFSETQRSALHHLIEAHTKWSRALTKFVVESGASLTAQSDFEEVVFASNISAEHDAIKSVQQAESGLHQTIESLNQIFKSILGDASIIFLKALEFNAHKSQKPLLLLLDYALHSLPIEATSFVELFNGFTSRDFSIDMYRNRMLTKGGHLTTCHTAHSSSFKYVIDPFGDDSYASNERSGEDVSIISTFNTIKSNKWKSIGKEVALSVPICDWSHALEQSGVKECSFVAIIPGQFSSVFRLTEFHHVMMDDIAMAIVLDRGHCERSFRRQLSIYNERDVEEIALDSHLAALLSLAGCRSLVLSQWSISFSSQGRFLKQFFEALFTGRGTVEAMICGNNIKPIVLDTQAHKSITKAPTTVIPKKRASVDIPKTVEVITENVPMKNNSNDESHMRLQNWIRFSRVVYGLAMTTYEET